MEINDRVRSQYNTGTVKGFSPDGKFARVKWDGFMTVCDHVPLEVVERIVAPSPLAKEPAAPSPRGWGEVEAGPVS